MSTINFTVADNAARTLTHTPSDAGYDGENEATVLMFAVPSAYSGHYKYVDIQPINGIKAQYGPIDPSGTTFSIPLYRDVAKQGALYVQVVLKLNAAEIHSGMDTLYLGRSINSTDAIVAGNRDVIEEIVERASNAETSAANVAKIINHTWWVWDPETAAYVDTGDPASPDAEQLTTVMLSEISTHNASAAAHPDIREDVRTVEAIARGRATALVFDTLPQLQAWLTGTYTRPDGLTVADLVTGDNLYIIDTGVKDYWWDGESAQELEAESPDLTDYYTKTQVDALLPIPITRADYDAAYAAGTLEADRDYDINEGT